jgi:hypothetical protein
MESFLSPSHEELLLKPKYRFFNYKNYRCKLKVTYKLENQHYKLSFALVFKFFNNTQNQLNLVTYLLLIIYFMFLNLDESDLPTLLLHNLLQSLKRYLMIQLMKVFLDKTKNTFRFNIISQSSIWTILHRYIIIFSICKNIICLTNVFTFNRFKSDYFAT